MKDLTISLESLLDIRYKSVLIVAQCKDLEHRSKRRENQNVDGKFEKLKC